MIARFVRAVSYDNILSNRTFYSISTIKQAVFRAGRTGTAQMAAKTEPYMPPVSCRRQRIPSLKFPAGVWQNKRRFRARLPAARRTATCLHALSSFIVCYARLAGRLVYPEKNHSCQLSCSSQPLSRVNNSSSANGNPDGSRRRRLAIRRCRSVSGSRQCL